MEATPWFVLFPARGAPPAWWQRVLAPGYRHCMAARADGPRRSLVVEHHGAAMVVQTVALPIAELVRDLQTALTALVLLVICPQGEGPAPLRLPMTCVEAVKAALGLASPWVLTPRQLARHLRRRHGALIVLPRSDLPHTEPVAG